MWRKTRLRLWIEWIPVQERYWWDRCYRIEVRRDAEMLCFRGGWAATDIAMTNQAKMQVKLIDYASAPLEKLYAAFRTCYSADTPIEIWEKIETEKISHEKIREFIAERLKTGHASPLEQVVFWFGISGVSRSLSHQFVRHRIGISFEQQSQRYVKYKEDRLDYVTPKTWEKTPGMHEEYERLMKEITRVYQLALEKG